MCGSANRVNVFVNEPDVYGDVGLEKYEEVDRVYCRGQEEIDYSTVDVVLVGLRDVVDDEFLRRFPRVKYVGSNTTGVDHIRTKRPIEVVHLDPREIESVSATAEFTLALLLSIARKIPFVDEAQAGDRKAYRGRQLRGKTLGVFGMGRLGRKMARYAEALGMSWVGYDRGQSEAEKAAVLRNADVITLHLPLNDETAGFLGYDEFALMEKKPFVVNTSRPQLIDKAALLDALDRSLVAGVAMDFINYDGSDRWDPDLRKHLGERLLLTPHIAGNTHESVRYTAGVVVEKLVRRVRSEAAG